MKKEFEDPTILVMPMLTTTQTQDSTGSNPDLGGTELPWQDVNG